MGAKFGKLAFAEVRKSLKQFFAGNQRQHGVAQKFQLLVVADFIFIVGDGLLRFLLARLGAVRNRLLNNRPSAKVVA